MTEERKYSFNGVEYITVKKFFSRVNSVFLIESINERKEQFILKDFENNSERMKAELKGMNIFKDFSPKVYYFDNRYLVHECIPGDTFLLHFEETEKNNSDCGVTIESLMNLLRSMYSSAPGYILGDINFNNFIVNSGSLQLNYIDYENTKSGEIEEDFGRIIAYALTYNPILTDWKYRFVLKFKDNAENVLKADKMKMLQHLQKELEAMNGRRQLQIDIPEVLNRVK